MTDQLTVEAEAIPISSVNKGNNAFSCAWGTYSQVITVKTRGNIQVGQNAS